MQMLGLSYTGLDFWDGLMDWRAELMEEGGGEFFLDGNLCYEESRS